MPKNTKKIITRLFMILLMSTMFLGIPLSVFAIDDSDSYKNNEHEVSDNEPEYITNDIIDDDIDDDKIEEVVLSANFIKADTAEESNNEIEINTLAIPEPEQEHNYSTDTLLHSFFPDELAPLAGFTTVHIRYLSGYPDSSVSPNSSVTRAEMCAMLYRLLDESRKVMPQRVNFTDIKQGKWYYQAVACLAHIGAINGYPDGTFKPDAPITRAEFVTIIARLFELQPSLSSKFPDISGMWAEQSIIAVENKSWISGYPDGTFKPQNKMTRSEAVTLINHMLGRGIASSDLPDWIAVYNDLHSSHWAYAEIMEASMGHSFERKGDYLEIWTGKPQISE